MTVPAPRRAAHDRLRPALTVVYGGGGPFGIAYGMGVADTLVAAGVPLRTAPALGTSAGAWVAACLATGTGFEALRAIAPVRVPSPAPGLLRRIAGDLLGEARSELVRASAVRLPTLRRTLLSGARSPLADLVAASSAVPGVFAPHRVGLGLYVDGGVRSLLSASHAPDADALLVVAPVAGALLGGGGALADVLLTDEVRRWERRCGGTASVVRPDRRVAALVRQPLDLFDHRRSCAAYDLAVEQTERLLLERPDLAALRGPRLGHDGSRALVAQLDRAAAF